MIHFRLASIADDDKQRAYLRTTNLKYALCWENPTKGKLEVNDDNRWIETITIWLIGELILNPELLLLTNLLFIYVASNSRSTTMTNDGHIYELRTTRYGKPEVRQVFHFIFLCN